MREWRIVELDKGYLIERSDVVYGGAETQRTTRRTVAANDERDLIRKFTTIFKLIASQNRAKRQAPMADEIIEGRGLSEAIHDGSDPAGGTTGAA